MYRLTATVARAHLTVIISTKLSVRHMVLPFSMSNPLCCVNHAEHRLSLTKLAAWLAAQLDFKV